MPAKKMEKWISKDEWKTVGGAHSFPFVSEIIIQFLLLYFIYVIFKIVVFIRIHRRMEASKDHGVCKLGSWRICTNGIGRMDRGMGDILHFNNFNSMMLFNLKLRPKFLIRPIFTHFCCLSSNVWDN